MQKYRIMLKLHDFLKLVQRHLHRIFVNLSIQIQTDIDFGFLPNQFPVRFRVLTAVAIVEGRIDQFFIKFFYGQYLFVRQRRFVVYTVAIHEFRGAVDGSVGPGDHAAVHNRP